MYHQRLIYYQLGRTGRGRERGVAEYEGLHPGAFDGEGDVLGGGAGQVYLGEVLTSVSGASGCGM